MDIVYSKYHDVVLISYTVKKTTLYRKVVLLEEKSITVAGLIEVLLRNVYPFSSPNTNVHTGY